MREFRRVVSRRTSGPRIRSQPISVPRRSTGAWRLQGLARGCRAAWVWLGPMAPRQCGYDLDRAARASTEFHDLPGAFPGSRLDDFEPLLRRGSSRGTAKARGSILLRRSTGRRSTLLQCHRGRRWSVEVTDAIGAVSASVAPRATTPRALQLPLEPRPYSLQAFRLARRSPSRKPCMS